MRFLGFRLYAPLASFGDVAVGERRPSLVAPTRSMVLGLVAACLGIRRWEADKHAELERIMGVATRTDAPGTLLVDYHTAQAPDGPRRAVFTRRNARPIATRREEVGATFDRDGEPHALDTQLSQRQYRTDAVFAVCLWFRDAAGPLALEEVAERLREPRFVPFAGRKSAALGLPFEPQLVDAANPVEALRRIEFSLDRVLDRITRPARERVYRWDGDWPEIARARTELRRDRVLDRGRWQFLTRDEHVLTEPGLEEAVDVPHAD